MLKDRLGHRLHTDETGVSPVIGTILMVAVTVIIAAVIGSTALGLSDSVSETPPRVSFNVEQNDVAFAQVQADSDATPVINITHVGGEKIEKKNVYLTVNDERAYTAFNTGRDGSGARLAGRIWHGDGTVTAGDTAHVAASISTSTLSPESVVDPKSDYEWQGDSVALDDVNGQDGNFVYDVSTETGDVVRIIYESNGYSNILYEYEVK